jgi:hypothetical protein
MRSRRAFITLLGAAAAWPLAARAQRPTNLHIGIATIQSRTTPIYAAFDQRLRELGHIEGQNLVTDYLNPESQAEGVPGAIKELVRRNVDITGGDKTCLSGAEGKAGSRPVGCKPRADLERLKAEQKKRWRRAPARCLRPRPPSRCRKQAPWTCCARRYSSA